MSSGSACDRAETTSARVHGRVRRSFMMSSFADARVQPLPPHILLMGTDNPRDFRRERKLRIAALDKAPAAKNPRLFPSDGTSLLNEVKHEDCLKVHLRLRSEQSRIRFVKNPAINGDRDTISFRKVVGGQRQHPATLDLVNVPDTYSVLINHLRIDHRVRKQAIPVIRRLIAGFQRPFNGSGNEGTLVLEHEAVLVFQHVDLA